MATNSISSEKGSSRSIGYARVARLVGALGIMLLVGACKSLTPDGALSEVTSITATAIPQDVVAIRDEETKAAVDLRVKKLLARTLSADEAVQLAFFRNAGLQAELNELGIAETALVSASLPPAPTISVARLSSSVEVEIERRIVGNILALATLPARTEIANDRFKQAKLRTAGKIYALATDVRRAYYQAVASQQVASLLEEAQSAAQAANELMRRLGTTGAVNKLDQAREQVFFAEITAQLAVARQNASADKEKLIRLLGLWGSESKVKLASNLPSVPSNARKLPLIERDALLHRVDLQSARIELDLLARSYNLTQVSRFITILDLAGINNSTKEADGARFRTRGVELEIQIPIFDLGETRLREAALTYQQGLNKLQEKAINVRSEARETYKTYRSAHEIALHYQREIVPLRKIISDEMVLRYNAMQIDVFELLTEARQRIAANVSAIEAQRNFWTASVSLFSAIVGGSSGSAPANSMSSAPAANEAAGH